jgi:heavy metal translocating P-type ATPase
VSALDIALTVAGALGAVLATWSVVQSIRERRLGADVLAVAAEVGALASGERVAAALIALMLVTGRVLEARARARAERELRALVERQPRTARRRDDGGTTVVPVDELEPGDVVVVGTAQVVPVDGALVSPRGAVDESATTGESLPRELVAGDPVTSGSLNAGPTFDLRVTARVDESAYAGIVRLATEAAAQRAPLVRVADRAALVLLVVGLAWSASAWAITGHLSRAVAVLVVATPCPLILAVPIALSGGLATTARRGVLVRGGDALERLATATALLVDKTGTLTEGRPHVVGVEAQPSIRPDEVLRLGAAADAGSSHVVAAAVVDAARERGWALPAAVDAVEEPGEGVAAVVDGRRVRVGSPGWIAPAGAGEAPALARAERVAVRSGGMVVAVEVDGAVAGAIVVADRPRPDARTTVRRLRELGIRHVAMVTGDRPGPARAVARLVGVDEVLSAQDPAAKLRAARELQRGGDVVVMVGDGINDAPVLAAADVGVAIGTGAATAATEVADVVIAADRIDRLPDALSAAQRACRIARQSAAGGVALSVAAMGVAAVGLLPPTWGALLQELIDVAAILNALRAVRGARHGVVLEGEDAAVAHRFSTEHVELRPSLDHLLELADGLGSAGAPLSLEPAREALRLLREEWEPHEQAEDAELYPRIAAALGAREATVVMSRAHAEISSLVDRLEDLLAVASDPPTADDVARIRGLLYGLHAVLVVHTEQEEEGYLSLAEDDATAPV